ncbi:MAG: ATP-binding protein [bacterium]
MRFFNSIRFKVILPVLLVFMVGIANFSYLVMWWQRNAFKKAALNEVETTSQIVMSAIADAMRLGKGEEVQEKIEDFKNIKGLMSLRVVDSEGRVVYARHRENIRKDMSNEIMNDMNPERTTESFVGRDLRMVSPIQNTEECHQCHGADKVANGYLVTTVRLDDLTRMASLGRNYNLGLAVITVVIVCSIILALLSHSVILPLRELEKSMSRLENGDLAVRTSYPGNDEIGRLEKSFNSMVNRLREAREEIESLHSAQMQRVEKLATLGQVAAGLAHEIKNPLAGIKGAIQVMVSESVESESRKEVYEEMLVQLYRMEKTVRDLLDFARPSPPSPKPTDLSDVVSRVASFVRRQKDAKSIRVEEKHERKLPRAMLDPDQVHQALLNIALNAVQAMPEGGTLRFSTYNKNGDLGITVTDTGPGIEKERLDKIFEPFYTTKHKGTGLGLSIVKSIVRANGGTISVRSETGKGTSFEILFRSYSTQ